MRERTLELWDFDELNYYLANLELHGIFWFSSQSHPYPSGFVQTLMPIIHNYPLLLAFLGQVSEESYVAGYNIIKRGESPAQRFNETHIYAYPALLRRSYYLKIFMSMAESDYILYKPRTRACVPLLAHYAALKPGSTGETIIISEEEMPREIYLRFGAKRFGIWKVSLKRAFNVEVVKGPHIIEFPFNVSDIKGGSLYGYIKIIEHYAGDIAAQGNVSEALRLEFKGERAFLLPIPLFISSHEE